jgi:hypothetical protein
MKRKILQRLARYFLAPTAICASFFAGALIVFPATASAQAFINHPNDPNYPYCYTLVTGIGQANTRCYTTRIDCDAAAGMVGLSCVSMVPNKEDGGVAWITKAWETTVEVISEAGSAILDETLGRIIKGLAWLIFELASRFMIMMSMIMDTAISITITSGFLGKLAVVDIGWRIVRDACNMVYIFVLLYIAIQTIVGLAGGQTRRLLANVIISALLINFSLFITKAVIDAGNIVAKTFWDNIKVTQGTDTINSFSSFFIGGTDIQTALDPESDVNRRGAGLSQTQRAIMYIGGTIVLFVMGYVFAAGAALMIVRTIGLIFVMIFSPYAFLGIALPKFSAFDSWLNNLIKHTFSAPVLVFFLYLITLVIQTGDAQSLAQSSGCGFGGLFSGKMPSCFTIMLQYMILITFLISALKMSSSWSGELGQKAVGLTRGIMNKGARQSVGRIGQSIARSKLLQRYAEKKGMGGWASRKLVLAGDKLQNLKIGGKGYKEEREQKDKEALGRAEVFTSPKAKAAFLRGKFGKKRWEGKDGKGPNRTYDKHIADVKDKVDREIQTQEHKETINNASRTADEQIKKVTELNDRLEALRLQEQDLLKANRAKEAEAIRAQISDAEQTLAETKKELDDHMKKVSESLARLTGAEVADLNLEVLKRSSVQQAMTGKDIVALNKKITDGKITDMEFVNNLPKSILLNGTSSAQDQMRKLARAPGSAFELDFAKLVEERLGEYNQLKSSGKLGEKYSKDGRVSPFTNEQYYRKEIGNLVRMMGSENVADLDEMLKEEIVASQLSKRDLGKIDKLQKEEGAFAEDTLETMRKHIVAAYESITAAGGKPDPRLKSAYEHIRQQQGGKGKNAQNDSQKTWSDTES